MSILVPYPGKEAACIFSYVTTRMQAMAGQPVEICVGNGLERSRYCLEFHNGHAMAGNHYAFSLQGTVDELRQIVFGLCNTVIRHAANIAIG